MNWIPHPLILEGQMVRLEPLDESHFDELILVSKDQEIWTYMPIDGTNEESLRMELADALKERNTGNQYPFVVIDKFAQTIIGCTRFLQLCPSNKSLEIGWTWYIPSYWGKGYNDECKLLLLDYCFEVLGTIRVQIGAAEKNFRSRKAIEKTGGQLDAIFRNFIIRYNGIRNTAIYSIIDDEWASTKSAIERRMRKNG